MVFAGPPPAILASEFRVLRGDESVPKPKVARPFVVL